MLEIIICNIILAIAISALVNFFLARLLSGNKIDKKGIKKQTYSQCDITDTDITRTGRTVLYHPTEASKKRQQMSPGESIVAVGIFVALIAFIIGSIISFFNVDKEESEPPVQNVTVGISPNDRYDTSETIDSENTNSETITGMDSETEGSEIAGTSYSDSQTCQVVKDAISMAVVAVQTKEAEGDEVSEADKNFLESYADGENHDVSVFYDSSSVIAQIFQMSVGADTYEAFCEKFGMESSKYIQFKITGNEIEVEMYTTNIMDLLQ